MMTCPSCGYQEETKFCKHCGAPMVSEAKAKYMQTQAYTGVTIPPPTATEGFKADDLEEIGLEGELVSSAGEQSEDSWTGLVLVGVIVVVLIAWAVSRVASGH